MSSADERARDGRVWRDFCERLAALGDAVLRPESPDTAFDRSEGFRYLTRLLRAGLESQLEFGDPRFPGFYQLANETIKIGNDNPDNVYLNARVSGRYTYRIEGTRGTVPYLSIGSKGGGYESDGSMRPTGQIDSEDLAVGPDGRLEILVSCEPQSGNWLPMTEDTTSLIVRQTFLDRASEEPARLTITCLNADGNNLLTPDDLDQALRRTTSFVEGTANLFVDWMGSYAAHINQLPSDDQEKCQRAGGDANIHYLQSYWQLAPDEALLVEPRRIPECANWNFQVSNFWMESLDYRYHRIHLNKHNAAVAADGRVRIVLSHQDPGPAWPNWLETAGHDRGGMLFRWIEAKEHPPVDTRVVKLSELK